MKSTINSTCYLSEKPPLGLRDNSVKIRDRMNTGLKQESPSEVNESILVVKIRDRMNTGLKHVVNHRGGTFAFSQVKIRDRMNTGLKHLLDAFFRKKLRRV